jgi:protoporphyrinogen oxidase
MLTYARQGRARRPFAYTYHTDPQLIFNRLYYPDNLLGSASPAHCEGVCAEILASPSLAGLDDQALLEATCQDLERLGLFPRRHLGQGRVVRLPDCMPVYPLDYEERMDQAFAPVHAIANLYAVGRRGGYFFCQTPAAVEQGMKMARHLLAAPGA